MLSIARVQSCETYISVWFLQVSLCYDESISGRTSEKPGMRLLTVTDLVDGGWMFRRHDESGCLEQ
jgi:hypothetical protein